MRHDGRNIKTKITEKDEKNTDIKTPTETGRCVGGQFLSNVYCDNQLLSLSLFKQEAALMNLIANPLVPQTREFKFGFDEEAFSPLISVSFEASSWLAVLKPPLSSEAVELNTDAPAVHSVFTLDPFRMQRTSSNVSTDLGSRNTLCVTII